MSNLPNLTDIEPHVYTKDFTDSIQKRVSKGVLYCELGKSTQEYYISYITVFFFLASFILNMYLLIKYTSASYYDDSILPFLIEVTITTLFLFSGLVLHLAFNRGLKIEQFNMKTVFAIGFGLVIGAFILIFQGVFNLIKFSIVAEDYYIFFLSVAIGEESLWRLGVQPWIKVLFNFQINKTTIIGNIKQIEANPTATRVVSSIMAISLTALLFTISHMFVYSSLHDLLLVFVMGCIFGIAFEATQRIDASIIAHVFVNAVAGWQLVILYFGGFNF
jgi:membrane protease YdiL (CAAX protease family)